MLLEDKLENKIINVGGEVYSFAVTEENIDKLNSRFQITISAPKVNTLVKAVGQSLCDDKETAFITIQESERGVKYSATWNGEQLSEVMEGTGSNIELPVRTTLLESGKNEITIWAAAGLCSQAALSERPVISVIERPEVSSVNDGSICNEGTATLTATGALEGGFYNWYETIDSTEPISGQQSSEFVTPVLSKTKTYYVAATNAMGCEGSRVAIKAVVSYMDAVTLTLLDNGALKSSQELGNQWFMNDQLIEGESSSELEVSEPGLYTIIVSKDGCSLSASREISDLQIQGGMNVEPMIKIYPNPSQNTVFIEVKTKNESVKAIIFSANGVEMTSTTLIGNDGIKQGQFNISSYTTGIYNIRIFDGSRLFIKKIAKVN
jgi:hypothetical protein